MKLKHVLESQQFRRNDLEELFLQADCIARLLKSPQGRRQLKKLLSGRLMCALFYEPSTRTRSSYEIGGQRLGMDVVSTENAAEFSSAAKGETLRDTIRVIAGYGIDLIVLRHREDGASKVAAETCDELGFPTHIFNAGDGRGQHPTQALLDMYTIRSECRDRQIDGLTVMIGGDLANGRTVRSLAYMLSRYKSRLIFVSPPPLAIGDDIKAYLNRHCIEFREETNPRKVFSEADVVYWTRIQRERIADPRLRRRRFTEFVISPAEMALMHPLPRVDEITQAVDADPRAAYFRQATNGLYVRMALLTQVFGVKLPPA